MRLTLKDALEFGIVHKVTDEGCPYCMNETPDWIRGCCGEVHFEPLYADAQNDELYLESDLTPERLKSLALPGVLRHLKSEYAMMRADYDRQLKKDELKEWEPGFDTGDEDAD